ncbi:unnamed protein product [Tetraodon nigroviridis]|uniref:(spotted green pufferfish) hypothetical protein n=1 Tax=Tetraodon nigroviridis TaxID=99883 RepID=Q4SNL7_TETNG|nr:unnamed protein product [Tetraodon nigroviridis]
MAAVAPDGAACFQPLHKQPTACALSSQRGSPVTTLPPREAISCLSRSGRRNGPVIESQRSCKKRSCRWRRSECKFLCRGASGERWSHAPVCLSKKWR